MVGFGYWRIFARGVRKQWESTSRVVLITAGGRHRSAAVLLWSLPLIPPVGGRPRLSLNLVNEDCLILKRRKRRPVGDWVWVLYMFGFVLH